MSPLYCRFISGKVLQAGDNNHFHPTCARCTKCGDPFGDGEEMYLQVDCDDDDTRYTENRAIIGLVVLVLKVVMLACHDIKRYLRKNCLIFIFHCRTQIIKSFLSFFRLILKQTIC